MGAIYPNLTAYGTIVWYSLCILRGDLLLASIKIHPTCIVMVKRAGGEQWRIQRGIPGCHGSPLSG